jgi:hypothetical protein
MHTRAEYNPKEADAVIRAEFYLRPKLEGLRGTAIP